MYRLYLLDADDTLFDFPKAERYAVERALLAFGLSCDDAQYATYSDINLRLWKAYERGETTQEKLRLERFARYLASQNIADVNAEKLAECFVEKLGEAAFLFPNAEPLVRALAKKAQLALFTNGISAVQRSRLAKSGLEKYFSALCISGELGFQKPDVRMVEAAMEMCGVQEKSAVLVVGDSQTADIECARRAGVDSCLYNPKDNPITVQPTYIVRSLAEVLELNNEG